MFARTNSTHKKPAGYFGWDLIDGEQGITALRDVLQNLSAAENGEDHRYARGVLVGVVATLCACGLTYDEAEKLAWQNSPTDCHWERIPEMMRAGWRTRIARHTMPK